MSSDADLLKLLREAAIEYSVFQLRLVQSLKEGVAKGAYGYGAPFGTGPLRADDEAGEGEVENDEDGNDEDGDDDGRRRRRRSSLADVAYEIARASIAQHEQVMRLYARQLDATVGVLQAAGRSACSPAELVVRMRVERAGERVQAAAAFRVENPYPFRVELDFGQGRWASRGGERAQADLRYERQGPDAGDFSLRPGAEARVRVVLESGGLAAGTHVARVPVLLDGRMVGRLELKVEVEGAEPQEPVPAV